MAFQTVTQDSFLKGLNAVLSKLVKSKGELRRVSNMLYTKRGGLVTCDGMRNVAGNFNSPAPMGARSPVVFVGPAILRGNTVPQFGVPISAVTAGTPAIITTAVPHGLNNRSIVAISGLTGNVSGLNGNWAVSYISSTQFALVNSSSASSYSIPTVNIASIASGTPMVVTTATNHGFTDGETVTLAGLTGTVAFLNGGWTIGYLSPTTFSLLNSSSGASAGAGGTAAAYSSATATNYVGVNTIGGGTVPLSPIFITYDPASQNIAVFKLQGAPYDPVLLTPKATLYSGPIKLVGQGIGLSTSGKPRFPQVINVGNVGFVLMGNDASPIILGNVNPSIQRNGFSYLSDYAVTDDKGNVTYPSQFGAAHGCYHLGRLWLFNTATSGGSASSLNDGPSVLRMSDSPTTGGTFFDFPDDQLTFLDRDDGTEGMGLASFTIAETGIAPTASIVAFKNFSAYTITGVLIITLSGPQFQISRVQTEMGCIAPRTIQFVSGFGVMRLSHLGVALFTGTRDQLISEEVRPYLFGGEEDIVPMDEERANEAFATVTTNPPMYVLAVPMKNDTQHSYESGLVVTPLSSDFLSDAAFSGVLQVPYTTLKVSIDGAGSPNTFKVAFGGGPAITSLSNATPIVCSVSSNHRLENGDEVTISGATGNTAGNGDWYIKVLGSGSFALYSDSGLTTPSVGNGAYTGGGAYVPTIITGIPITGDEQFIPLSTSQQYSGIIVRFGSKTGHHVNDGWTVTSYYPVIPIVGCHRFLCYDLILKAWTVIDTPTDLFFTCGNQVRIPGVAPVTVFGSANKSYVLRWQAGDDGWIGTGVAGGVGTQVYQWGRYNSPANVGFISTLVKTGMVVGSTFTLSGVDASVNGSQTVRTIQPDVPGPGDFITFNNTGAQVTPTILNPYGSLTVGGGSVPGSRPINWMFQPEELAPASAAQRTYFRRSVLRAKAPESTVAAAMKISGAEQTISGSMSFKRLTDPSKYGSSYYGNATYGDVAADLLSTFDIAETSLSIAAQYSGSGRVEILGVDYHVVQKPAGAFGRVS